MKADPKKMSPLDYAKRNAHRPIDKRGNKKIPYIHVQDIEDYYDDYQRTKFYGMIDEMKTAEKQFGLNYELGYSNYTFELWMLLHVADMTHSIQDRHSYLPSINKWFHRNYQTIDEFKSHDEFQGILDEFVTLDSIKTAINHAETIVGNNKENRNVKETYKGFSFYRDNPDVTVHEVVQMIFEVCEVR